MFTHKLTKETMIPVRNASEEIDSEVLTGVVFKIESSGKEIFMTDNQIEKIVEKTR